MSRRVISLSVNPGQPTDGSGVVCIHLFVRDEKGPFEEPHVLRSGPAGRERELVAGPARGRLACDARRTVAAAMHNGVTRITMRTDDPRAVTCPKCMASPLFKKMMELVEPTGITESDAERVE